jgi:hypothetical protein
MNTGEGPGFAEEERAHDETAHRNRLFELIERNWEHNRDAANEDVERDIRAAIAEVRARRHRNRPQV